MVKFYKNLQRLAVIKIITGIIFALCLFSFQAMQAQVVVTAPAEVTMCVSGGYVKIGTIKIAETVNTDFAFPASNKTYSISPSANFQFNTTAAAKAKIKLTSSTGVINMSVVTLKTDTLTIKFDLNAGLSSFTIDSLEVQAINSASSGFIKRSGGTEGMNGNAVSDGQVHALLVSDPPATFFGLQSDYCRNADPDTLIGFPVDPNNATPFAGSSAIVNLGGGKALFDPSIPGVIGVKNITYTYCNSVITKSTTILATTTPTFPVPGQTVYSSNSAPVVLRGNPKGGVFSGPGVVDTLFNPSILTNGQYKVIYTYTNPITLCKDTVSKTFTVQTNSSSIPNLSTTPYCISDANPVQLTLPSGQYPSDLAPGFYGDLGFYMDGILVPGTPSIGGTPGTQYFTPSTAGLGLHNIEYKYSFFGLFTFTWVSAVVNVVPLPTVKFTINDTYCSNQGVSNLIGTPTCNGVGGTGVFSGLNVTGSCPNYKFDPSLSANGVGRYIKYKYTDNYGCTNADSNFTTVFLASPTSINGLASTFCQSDPQVLLSGTPSGGTFTGGGVLFDGANYFFTPSVADTASPNAVKYTIIAGLCSSSNTQNVDVKVKAIPNAGINLSICAGTPVTLSNLNPSVKGSAIPNQCNWGAKGTGPGGSGGDGSFRNASNNPSTNFTSADKYIPSPQDSLNGSVKLYLTTNDPVGPCGSVTDTTTITFKPLPVVQVVNLKAGYCRIAGSVINLQGSPAVIASSLFTGLGVSGNSAAGFIFAPQSAGVAGPKTITYTYTDPATTCTNSASAITQVYDLPKVGFTRQGACENTNVVFKDTSTFTNPDFIQARVWNFSDNVANSNTLSNQTYTRTFSPAKNYQGKLTVTSNHGCVDSSKVNFDIGPYPKADFKWDKICSVDSVDFTNQSTIPVASTFTPSTFVKRHWDFGVTSIVSDTSNQQDTAYYYPGVGSYNVSLKMTTNFGCADSITKRVFILPTYNPTSLNPYIIHFKDSTDHWDTDGNNTSWTYNSTSALNKDSINSGTDKIWITGDSTFNVNEQSALNSPCYNFQYLDRPMIALKIWSATRSPIAGAILQSSIDDGLTWKIEGKVGVGQNWYETSGVIGMSGIQPLDQYAWTGQYGGWHVARLGLDHLANKPTVRFRVVFGSSLSTLNLSDGFAVDSVWIGNKNKFILLEHFTNFSTAACSTGNAKVNTLWNNRKNSLAEIQYHTSFPDFTDPMSQKNTPDPSTRVLFYGLSQVPYTVLDGNYFSGNVYGPGAGLDTTDIDAKSLDNAKFGMVLQTFNGTDSLNAQVKIKANLQVNDAVVVNLAVVERVISSLAPGPQGTSAQYEWVLKKMLPDAAGTYFPLRTWNINDSAKVSYNWIYAPSDVYSAAQLGVVAFIQSASTKEIFQTIYSFGTDTVGGSTISGGGGFVTGLSDPSGELKVHVYPNPTSEKSFVMFNKKVSQEFDWEVYDQLGKVMDQGKVRKGSEGFVLNTSSYASGMYVVKIGNGENVLYTKLLVVH